MKKINMNQYRQEMTEALSAFIRIDSAKAPAEPNRPYGRGVFDALMFIHSLTDRMDLNCVNMFGHLVYVEAGEGSETLAVLSHVDVVPEGEGWTHDPFGGEIDGGRIYGRGAIDDKGPAIASLFALKALCDNCFDFKKKVRLIFGGDEETGMGDIAYYLDHEAEPDYLFTPDADFPIINCEKGNFNATLTAKVATPGLSELRSGTRLNVVPSSAHAVFYGNSIDTHGTSAHAAVPWEGKNAAGLMMLELAKLTDSPAVHSLAYGIGTDVFGENAGVMCKDDISGELTLNLGLLSCTDDGRIQASIDIRFPVCKTAEWVGEQIKTIFGEHFDVDITYTHEPHYVSPDSPVVRSLSEAYEEVTGEKAECLSIGGGTYAKHFANGVAFGPEKPGRYYSIHGPEEYIEIDDLIELSELIYTAIVKICG